MAKVRLNPRQRRGVGYLVLAGVGAVAVFVSVSSYVADVRADIGPEVPALRLVADVAAYDAVDPAAIETVGVPARWLPETAVSSPTAVEGLVASTELRAGSLLQADMLIPPPDVGPGERAVALALPAAQIAPDVARGDLVDVLAAFGGPADAAQTPPSVDVVVEGGLVLAREPLPDDVEGREQLTFALPAEDALRLGFAQSYAVQLSVLAVGPQSPPLAPAEKSYSNEGGDRP